MKFENPILESPEVMTEFTALSDENKKAIYRFLRWLYKFAGDKSETAWRQKKAPMAVYWSAVKAWSLHLSHVVFKRLA